MKLPEGLIDLSEKARKGLIDRPIGRDQEIKSIQKYLLQEGKANVMLLGPAGVGKTMIVEGLALELLNQTSNTNLGRILDLQLNTLMSGTQYRGDLESKIKDVLDYLIEEKDTVVFIDEIHMLMGFGATRESKSSDLSQILKPFLARGEIRCIGATTDLEFQSYIASDAAFARRFQILKINEISDDFTLEILNKLNIKNKYIKNIFFSESTLKNIILYAHKSIPNRKNPDKTIDTYKNCILGIETNNNDSSNIQKSNSNYAPESLNLFMDQLEKLKKQDFDGATLIAKKILGVDSKNSKMIELSERDINLHNSNKG